MYNHKFCKEAHQHMHEIMEMWRNGENMTTEAKIDYLVNRAICMDYSKEDYWKSFHSEVYSAEYPEVDYDEEKAKENMAEIKVEEKTIISPEHHNKTEFSEKIKYKDKEKVMEKLNEFFDTLKAVDNHKYLAMMSSLDKI